jgi:YD repeat-containing protein
LNGALITTYTYNPLVGITSQTDPNGVATYYEYDSMGRLWRINNDKGNVLKQYDYHYSTQP